ncbi:hypothetical protein EV190_1325 [Actinorugispora endophytica]|uniref:Uncharacterized protein n=2 Tax=Actinorugispora endophytica TaxID=1605990 RepID=A0A4R6UJ98_9ACTN|nr:hypothetical protein EV190_1325 [Actinorugispora endophytica]
MLCRWEHGPTRPGLDYIHALDFYAQRYSHYPPRALAAEVSRCRSLLIGHGDTNTEARHIIGWLSALLGNLAHHTDDSAGALIHLSTAARIGTEIGHAHLTGWSLGAQSMVAHARHRPTQALDLADQAAQHAHTPLHRAQITAWCRLRPLAALGRTEELATATTQARHHMDAAQERPGRFGFDQAEFHLHLAEAHLSAGNPAAAAAHAQTSLAHKRAGSPGWAAATVVHARAHAAQRQGQDAVAVASSALEAIPAGQLRATTRGRLTALVRDLEGYHPAQGLRAMVHEHGQA